MNKRELQKKQTRRLLLDTAKDCFAETGFLNTPVGKISAAAGVAHGTLFSHFKNKEALILEVLDKEMGAIGDDIQELVANSDDVSDVLAEYLMLIEKEEKFFAMIAKETPFYNIELRRKLIFRDSVIRSYFFQMVSDEYSKNSSEEITSALNWLFGAINYYLVNRDIFAQDESVISKFRNSIIKTFNKIISEVK